MCNPCLQDWIILKDVLLTWNPPEISGGFSKWPDTDIQRGPTLIELIWTITPALVLIAIAFPSFKLLYMLDEVISPTMTIKVAGLKLFGLKSNIHSKINKILSQLYAILCVIKFSIVNIFYKYVNQLFLFFLICLFFFDRNDNSTFMSHSKHGIRQNELKTQKRSFHTSCRAINRIGPHNEDVIAVLIGLLLGDGYAANRSGEGVRFSIKQSITHKDYLFSLYEFFLTRGYCSKLEPRKYTRTIKGVDKEYYGYEFNTFTFRSFYWLYSSFYKNGKKIVPQILEKYMTALTLAIWIEMNGSWVQGKLVLNTCFSSKKDIEILVKVLQNSFGIKSYLKMSKKGKYRIEISSESINLIKRQECPKIFQGYTGGLTLVKNCHNFTK